MPKEIFFVMLLLITNGTLLAQNKMYENCLFIGNKEKYVLSETGKPENSNEVTYNSLFLWQKDKVVRIVFLYDQKTASKYKIQKLKSFNNLLPSFKNYVVTANHDRNSDIYDGKIIDKKTGETSNISYNQKLKTVINVWNKKYNPLADKFASIPIQDGDPEVLIYNEKRKGRQVNNLPILLNSTKGDSIYIISPLVIDIYKLETAKTATHKVITYKLYTTISFLERSVTLSNYQYNNNEESYKSDISYFIAEHTLPYLYKTSSNYDKKSFNNLENIDYFFSKGDKKYFKMRVKTGKADLNPVLNFDPNETEQYYWQLISPNIGYWMYNIGEKSKTSVKLKLNDEIINQ